MPLYANWQLRTDLKSVGCGFESDQGHQTNVLVAQLVEQEPSHGKGPIRWRIKLSRWFESILVHKYG